MPNGRTVTRDDVARFAGVSPAVVSYVVNKGPRPVRASTEAKVLEAIRVLGYRPNAAARALRLRSQEILGLVLSAGGNALYMEMANAIEDAAKTHGFAVILTNSRGSAAKEREHLRNLVARHVDGILLASVDKAPDVAEVTEAGVPILLLDNGGSDPALPSAGADFEGSAYEAVTHLIGHGHHDIAMISGPAGDDPKDPMEAGWARALAEGGRPQGPIISARESRFGGYQAATRLLAAPNRPTALFTRTDTQAVGALRAAHEAGLRVPEDLALISFDGSTEAEYTWPPLSTMRQPVDDMARDTVAALLAVKSGGGEPRHMTYPTTLQARASCGCDGGRPTS